MRAVIISILTLLSFQIKAQEMEQMTNVVTQLFVATDLKDWPAVEQCFADQVQLDYSSMTGNPPVTTSPAEITTSWKGILPGFEHTHHQLGNFLSTREGDKGSVFCYGTATHFLTNEEGNIWTVVGSYEFDLKTDSQGRWLITMMKFNFKYQDGNTGLPEKAIERAKI